MRGADCAAAALQSAPLAAVWADDAAGVLAKGALLLWPVLHRLIVPGYSRAVAVAGDATGSVPANPGVATVGNARPLRLPSARLTRDVDGICSYGSADLPVQHTTTAPGSG